MLISNRLPDTMPHDSITITDRSIFPEIIPVEQMRQPVALIPIFSARGTGKDNELTHINSLTGFEARFGTQNIKKYGFSQAIIARYLEGGGSVFTARLMPEDSTHANFVWVAKVKVLEDQEIPLEDGDDVEEFEPDENLGEGEKLPGVPPDHDMVAALVKGNVINVVKSMITDVLEVEHKLISLTNENASSIESIRQTLQSLYVERDENGYTHIPMAAFAVDCKGKDANNFSIRIALDASMELMATDGRFYRMSVLRNGRQHENPVTFCLKDGVMYNGQSMFLEDVVKTNSATINATASPYIDKYYELLALVTGSEDVYEFDIITGKRRDGKDHIHIRLTDTSAPLNPVTGIRLKGGSDGSLDPINPELAERTRNELLADFYRGKITHKVKDSKRYRFRHVLDVTDDFAVKNAMAELVDARHSTIGFISGSTQHETYAQVASTLASRFRHDTPFLAFYPESAVYLETSTGKRHRMPASYIWAAALASHCQDDGFTNPFFGRINGFATGGFIKDSLRPIATDDSTFTMLHRMRSNQVIETSDGFAEPYNGITMQARMSKLSEINNVHILCELVDMAIDYADATRGTTIDGTGNVGIEEFRRGFSSKVNNRFGSKVDSVDIVVDRESVTGAGANRLRCTLHVYFKDVLKGISYEFVIN